MRSKAFFTASIALALLVGVAQATLAGPPPPTETVVQAQADTYVRDQTGGQGATNNGCERLIEVSTSRFPQGNPDLSRSLIRFDTSGLPSVFQSAVLELTVHTVAKHDNDVLQTVPPSAPSVFTVDVHRITGPWIEGSGAYEPRPPGCTGIDPWQFVPPGAATWNAQPTFDSNVVATAQVVQGTHVKGSVIRWDVTSLVRDWVNGTVDNHGLLLRDVTTDGFFRLVDFGAREGRLYESTWPPGDVVDGPRLVLTFDTEPPVISCASADSQWHIANISLACTAEDLGSGLANPADASFSLVTAVATGEEIANAFTGSHEVCDNAGNCATALAIGGNKIDRLAPAIQIAAPAATTFTLGQALNANYACTDNGSGVNTCTGPVASGAPLPLSNPGAFTFAVNALDLVGNTASSSVPYQVAYRVCVLFDPWWPVRSGATFPIVLRLCDINGVNKSAPSVALAVLGIVPTAGGAVPVSAFSSSFRYDPWLRLYSFALKTKGLARGTYELQFKAGADPTVHSVPFRIR